MTRDEQTSELGTISRDCREGDRMMLSVDGKSLGYIEIVRVPNDAKIRLCFCIDKRIKLTRRDRNGR